ncbi:MAG: hypothetical protein OMOMHJEC_00276 [Xanthomonadales bacterium]|nr:hypothetical protein [Xanthomonadales bacterium]
MPSTTWWEGVKAVRPRRLLPPDPASHFPSPPTMLRPLFWLSLPVLLPQALWLKCSARRLPPATGARAGVVGQGKPLKLLLLGDSIVDGVGVERLEDALPGQLARALAMRCGARVEWHASGCNGARCRELRAQLARLPVASADLAFVSVGVNDVTGLTTAGRFALQLRALLAGLRAHSPAALIVLAGIPPMEHFPALPTPLRQALGWRAARLDSVGRALAVSSPGVCHLPTPVPDDPAAFAEDGYHPNARACARWAQTLVASLDLARLHRLGNHIVV